MGQFLLSLTNGLSKPVFVWIFLFFTLFTSANEIEKAENNYKLVNYVTINNEAVKYTGFLQEFNNFWKSLSEGLETSSLIISSKEITKNTLTVNESATTSMAACGGTLPEDDFDCDTILNVDDLDDDNDGVLDTDECMGFVYSVPVVTEGFEAAGFVTDAGVNDAACAISGCNVPKGGGITLLDPSTITCWQPTTGVVESTKGLHPVPSGKAAVFNAFAANTNANVCRRLGIDYNGNGRFGEIVSIGNVSIVEGVTYSVAVYAAEITNTNPYVSSYSFEFYNAGTSTPAGIPNFSLNNITQGNQNWQLNETDFTAPATKNIDIVLVQTNPEELGADIALDAFSILRGICSGDTDKDGVLNIYDLDSDNDGISDVLEAGGLDLDNDGKADGPVGTSVTTNGVPNSAVNGVTPINSDGDAIPDYLDIDADNDGIPDNIEAQPTNGYIAPSGIGTSITDSNNNGIDDSYEDTLTGILKITPVNTDATDTPDYLDSDSDNDGILDIAENGDTDNVLANTDVDNDGLDDNFDDNDDSSNSGFTVNDGINPPNASNLGDIDNDFSSGGEVDYRDDVNLTNTDSDNDGIIDTADVDDDNDGILDIEELCPDGPTYLTESKITLFLDLDAFETRTTWTLTGPSGFVSQSGGPYVNADDIIDLEFITTVEGQYKFSLFTSRTPTGDGSNENGTSFYRVAFDGVVQGQGDPFRKQNTNGTSNLSFTRNLTFPLSPYVCLTADPSLDSDNDGILNYRDPDYAAENGSTIVNGVVSSLDKDGDGIPNHLDLDSDNDGVPDIVEVGGTDADGNGKVDALNPNGTLINDTDNDGLDDLYDSNNGGTDLTNIDSDNDGVPNSQDLDADNDGIADIVEAGGEDTDGNGKVDDLNANGTLINDTDGDGIDNRYDVDNGGSGIGNPDTDGDGVPNSQDLDSDNDGVTDIIEAGGADNDSNGVVDGVFTDTDGDGFNDAVDGDVGQDGTSENISNVLIVTGDDANNDGKPDSYPNTDDTDGDGQLNLLDLDSDNDGIPDVTEAGGTDANNDGRAGDDDNNADNTGSNGIPTSAGTGTIVPTNTDNDGVPDYLDLDSDNDGIPDVTEAGGTDLNNDGRADDDDNNVDNSGSNGIPTSAGTGLTPTSTDGDSIPDYLDLDADNDGIPDNIEAQTTIGYVAPSGADTDNDGLDDAYDPDCTGANCSGVSGAIINPVNADNADTADYIDLDADNDGVFDVIESGSGLANDGNGVVTGAVGTNGLVDAIETGDTDQGYTDVNGEYDNTQADNFTDTDGDVNTGGDVDYRDAQDNDNDKDGVPDSVDIDDDNDGILDTEECTVSPANISQISSSFVDSGAPGDVGDIAVYSNITTYNGESIDLRVTVLSNSNPANMTVNIAGVGSSPNIYPIFLGGNQFSFDGDSASLKFEYLISGTNTLIPVIANFVWKDIDVVTGFPSGNGTESITFNTNEIAAYTVDTPTNIIVNSVGGETVFTSSLNSSTTDTKIMVKTEMLKTSSFTASFRKRDGPTNNTGYLFGSTTFANPVRTQLVDQCEDTDGDKIPDYLDLDADNDGIPDNIEGQTTTGYVAPSGADTDNDGLDDAYDPDCTGANCSGVTGALIVPVNTDGADTADYIDLDADNDGIFDVIESGSGLANDGNGVVTGVVGTNGLVDAIETGDTDQGYTDVNGEYDNTQADNFADTDGDVNTGGDVDYRDAEDNDNDNDGIPDSVDLDDDNDGIPDTAENGVNFADGDEDGDGIPNYKDTTDNGNGGDGSTTDYTDSNNDGIPDVYDADGDGVPNHFDLDSDNDGVADIVEAGGEDTDGNGKVDDLNANGTLVNDTDNDGIDDRYDVNNGGNSLANLDSDGDGVPNSQDLDSDNDGITDIIEAGGLDTDGNGKVDGLNANGTLTDDIDGDGFSDVVDGDVGQDGVSENTSSVLIVTGDDANNDGKPDSYPSTDDTDGDGQLNLLDLDSDNDGIPDVTEAGGTDTNNDGRADDDDNNVNNTGSNGIPTSAGTGLTPTSTDGDSIPDYLDLDADNDGIPDNIEAQTTLGYVSPSGADTDKDGLDDAYDPDCTGINCSGVIGALIVPVNTDGADTADYIDLHSDNDGIFDVIESGSGLANNGSGVVTGVVGTNGLVDAIETGDTDQGYTDVNGEYDNTQADNFTDTDGDVITGGDVDYRDIPDSADAMITQVYQFGADTDSVKERWIEITNIGITDIPANTIKVQLYKDKSGDQTGIAPDVSYTVGTILEAGNSVLFKNSNNSIILNSEIAADATTVVNDALTDINGGDDIITLSTAEGSFSWENRYDVISSITNNTSFVRIDETLTTNKDYKASEWVAFIDDNIAPYQAVNNPGSTVVIPRRHPQDPLISEIKTSSIEANTLLGLHTINITTSNSNSNTWTNGFPDRSRSVVIDQDFEHTGNRLSARKLKVNTIVNLTVTNQLLVVTNDLILDGNIRLAGTSQLVQTHTGGSTVTSTLPTVSGKLLVEQNSEITSLYRYGYMSSPVTSGINNTFTVKDVLKDGTTPLDATSIIGTTLAKDIKFIQGYDGAATDPISLADYWIYTYAPGANGRSNWVHKYRSGSISRGDGFIFKGPGRPQNYTFVGVPNDGEFDTSTSINAEEDYLIGNPFASAMNARKFMEDNVGSIEQTLYFWDHQKSANGEGTGIDGHIFGGYIGGYATLNLTMGLAANSSLQSNNNNGTSGLGNDSSVYKAPKPYIAIAQGFFVEGNATGGDITFNNSQRAYVTEEGGVNSESVFFKGSKKRSAAKTASTNNLLPIIKLGFEYKNAEELLLHHQIGISFQETNSFGYDKGADSEAYGIDATDMYWKFSNDDKKYVIAGVQSISDDLEVPLEITMGYSGEVDVMIDEKQNISRDIYITDKLSGTSHRITDGKITLTLDKGVYSDRFVLAFSENSVLSLEGDVLSNSTHIYADNKNHSIVVSKDLNVTLNKVELFDILGKEVRFWNIKEQKTSYELDIQKHIPTGVYIVKINTDKGTINKKVVID
ncbi:T9SS type A sorting domain-containing protein [Polaribacter sp. L3A8]|uniref:T9SS type A sorting domain-containing protein n=1 Tax=Polaribacter sp. L3A8 TaxID=2686361 RepID=UPI00131D25B4|nr:T9SS type A sorting domain-containing protein [Polaribacter sp. L3A8]